MAKTWQLIIIATCTIALGSIVTFGKESDGQTVPYSPVNSRESASKRSSLESRKETDLAAAAGTVSSVSLQPQPSVYHSIIDKTSTKMASPIQTSATAIGDLTTAAGHHHGHAHGKYYEYREVPKKKTWKFGYKRGNHKHHIERHEHGVAGKHPHFKTKVKWSDKKSKGKGIHLWDYNHHDKKHGYHG